MSDPIEDGEGPRWWLRIGLGLLAAALIAAWGVVWFVSSPNFHPPHFLSPPAPIPRPKPVRSADGHLVTNPDWSRRPTANDIARYYPQRAQRLNVGGRAVIACMVARNGQLVDCKVVSETPPGWEFGEAAVRMSSRFRMWPKTVDGKPVDGGQVRIPIVFSPPN